MLLFFIKVKWQNEWQWHILWYYLPVFFLIHSCLLLCILTVWYVRNESGNTLPHIALPHNQTYSQDSPIFFSSLTWHFNWCLSVQWMAVKTILPTMAKEKQYLSVSPIHVPPTCTSHGYFKKPQTSHIIHRTSVPPFYPLVPDIFTARKGACRCAFCFSPQEFMFMTSVCFRHQSGSIPPVSHLFFSGCLWLKGLSNSHHNGSAR